MSTIKKIISAAIAVMLSVGAAATHAEEFVWDFGESRPRGGASSILFGMLGDVKISDYDEWAKMRETVYGEINAGNYKSALFLCDYIDSVQKLDNGKEFVDNSLLELRKKLKQQIREGKNSNEFNEPADRTGYDEMLKQLQMVNLLGIGTTYNLALPRLHIYRQVFSDHDPTAFALMKTIAESYVSSGQSDNASKVTQQMYKLSETHHLQNSVCMWMTLDVSSKILRAKGRIDEALALDNRALKLGEKVCGKDSRERLASADAIAIDHEKLNNFTEALKIRSDAVRIYEQSPNSDKTAVELLVAKINLASNYVSCGDYQNALNLCSVLPTTNPTVMKIQAEAYKLSGDNERAANSYADMVADYESLRDTFNSAYVDESDKTRWFTSVVANYRQAALVNVLNGGNTNAFLYAEYCKGNRTSS